jgi:hypothetical protein
MVMGQVSGVFQLEPMKGTKLRPVMARRANDG